MRGEMNSYRFEISNRREKVLFAWSFISAAFQSDPIFWWTCVGISFWVVFTWYFITRNEFKMTDMKSIPAMSFKHTCALNVIFNESALIHFVSGKFCSHENLMPVNIHVNTSKELTEYRSEIFNRNEISYRSEFISPLMWTYSNSTNFIAWLPLLLEILGNMWCIARFGTICTI